MAAREGLEHFDMEVMSKIFSFMEPKNLNQIQFQASQH